MITKEEQSTQRSINIGLLVFHLTVPIAFFSLVLFIPNLTSGLIANLRPFLISAILGFIYFFIFRKLVERDLSKAYYSLFLVNFSYIVVAINATGGISSPLLFAFYFLIAISYFVSAWYGVGISLLSVLYLFLDIYANGKEDYISNPIALWPQIVPLAITSIPFLFLGIAYRKSVTDKKSMMGITEKLSTDKNLEEAIFTSITDGLYAVDNERNLVLFNKAAEEMTGFDTNSALGLKCWTVMKFINNEKSISICEKDCPMLEAWNADGGIVRDDLCIAKKGGNSLQISGAYSPIKDINGKITGGACIIRDVTKRKEVERLRNEFVSTASHELRTPITTLEGYIDLATNKKVSKIDEKAEEYLTKAHNTVLNMSTLVKNLLSVTKIDEGKIDMNVENFEISELIELTVQELERLAVKKGVKLDFSKSNIGEKGKKSLARSVNVAADKSMIKEVLINLIENAVKFTLAGSVTVSVKYDNDFVTVQIEDTGVGIPQEAQKHLFEKFYRVDNTATREVGGTGLGLYITRSIVELNGGKIWVESKSGKGTKFFFTIPRALV